MERMYFYLCISRCFKGILLEVSSILPSEHISGLFTKLNGRGTEDIYPCIFRAQHGSWHMVGAK